MPAPLVEHLWLARWSFAPGETSEAITLMLEGGDHSMFVCGDEIEAEATVTDMRTDRFGWQDVIDLGVISMAGGTEIYLELRARLYGALQNPMFSIKVVRSGWGLGVAQAPGRCRRSPRP